MGKKSTKGKEKKEKRKEEIMKKNEAVLAVKNANMVDDPLAALPAFATYKRNELDLTLHSKRASQMSEDEMDICYNLVKDNMQLMYENSNWGWNEKEKKIEMTEENARYLYALDGEKNIVAMTHFRFDVDDDVEVIYCYEIQLVNSIRGKGLGKFMIQVLELMALKAKMKKVVLTVFKANSRAVNFFNKLKYTIDCTSPHYIDPLHPEDYDYEIMSKSLPIR